MDYAFTLYSALLIAGCFARLVFTTNVCSMCHGEQTKNISNCNHSVHKDNVIQNMDSLLSDIDKLIEKEEEKLNMIKTSEFSKEHLPCRLRKRKKIHKKIRFIHETYENLTFVYHVLERVGDVFDINGTNILKRVKNLLCLMHQENNRFHCPKKALTFSATTSCKKNKIKSFKKGRSKSAKNCSESNKCIERRALVGTRTTLEILNNTLSFWKDCVRYKRGHLFLRRKCRRRKNKKKCKRKS